jgi:enediyne biosynthesis protein E4
MTRSPAPQRGRLPRLRRAAAIGGRICGLPVLVFLLACQGRTAPAPPAAPSAPPPPIPIVYTDVTREAGITFVHDNGAFGKKYLPETMGSGLAFLDYDGDGRQDLFFVNSTGWPGRHRRRGLPALYRNRGDGTFEDVTRQAGLAIDVYGIGVAAADYDGDGHTDLFLTVLGPDRLFHNRGDGTFEDVSVHAGVADPGFGSSATFLDYDHDGRLDLFVCNYVEWTPATDIFCTLDGVDKSYCTPESYKGSADRLYHNRGDGTFEDATVASGIFRPDGKSLGVVALDYDGDGWTDLAVANDTQPNLLYHNRHDGTFEEVGKNAGIAYSEDGKARGAMGIDAADYDGSGRDSLIIGNFSNEMLALYHNEGRGLFIDDAATAGIGEPSLLTLAFGCFFFDYDLDGRLDVFVANGHVETDINRVQPSVTYAQPPHLFRGLPGGRFEQDDDRVGAAFATPRVARGAAYADYDGDGDLDIALSVNGGPAVLLRNDGGNAHGWLRVRLVGRGPNPDAIGAVARLRAAGLEEVRTVRSASSYASQSEMVLTFGLGPAPAGGQPPVEVDVTWPDGSTRAYTGLAPNQLHTLRQ